MVGQIVIYPVQVKILLGCSHTTASKKLQQVRDVLGKKPESFITIKEFCDYWEIPLNDVLELLKIQNKKP